MSHKKEVWKAIRIDGKKPSVPYVISSHGRFGVADEAGKVQVKQIRPSAGTYRYNTRQQGKNKAVFLHREVARNFLKKPSARHSFVIHKDHDYLNNHIDNLKWATRTEHRLHTAQSPRSVLARQKRMITRSANSKVLSEKQVLALKKMIWDPERKQSFKQLAGRFGVSEMQIYRIKKGEFWYHLRVDHEPVHPKYRQNIRNIAYHRKQALKTSGPARTAAVKRKRI
jgi:hypothetical protein